MQLGQVLLMSQVQKAQNDNLAQGGCTSAAPASLGASDTCEGAYESGHVASHTSTFPDFHGMMEHPSGRFPLDLHSPVGSGREGILVEVKALSMMLVDDY